jgi:hypothetical protein
MTTIEKNLVTDHILRSVTINAKATTVFDYIANPRNLPFWTNAFKEADESSALMVTPVGELKILLKTIASEDFGTIDWFMTTPDGSVASAYSRVVPAVDNNKCIYSFVLMTPPLPLEILEGTLAQQGQVIEEELKRVAIILNGK